MYKISGPHDSERHAGDLGNIYVNEQGEARFRLAPLKLNMWDIIGRGLVITEHQDDLGKGNNTTSKVDGNAGKGVSKY